MTEAADHPCMDLAKGYFTFQINALDSFIKNTFL